VFFAQDREKLLQVASPFFWLSDSYLSFGVITCGWATTKTRHLTSSSGGAI